MSVTYELHKVNVGKKPIKKLLCCLSVKSDEIREVRKDFGLDPYWIKLGKVSKKKIGENSPKGPAPPPPPLLEKFFIN